MSETVLVIAAHPDDEILGLGGTLARHSQAGDEVHCIIMAEGATSRQGDDGEDSNDELSALKAAARNAAADIGMKSPVFANFSDNRMDTSALLDVVQWLENEIKTIVPSIVYTHHSDDLNLDHQIVHKAVLTAFRSLREAGSIPDIYTFETPSSTEWGGVYKSFEPTHYVNISATLDIKMRALRHYKMELRDFPHPRSMEAVEALARWRGAEAAFHAAEAFGVVRTRWS